MAKYARPDCRPKSEEVLTFAFMNMELISLSRFLVLFSHLFCLVLQVKQTKDALTRKQQKCQKKNDADDAHDPAELLKRPKEYTVKFTFPNPPSLSPPILGLHGKLSFKPRTTLAMACNRDR